MLGKPGKTSPPFRRFCTTFDLRRWVNRARATALCRSAYASRAVANKCWFTPAMRSWHNRGTAYNMNTALLQSTLVILLLLAAATAPAAENIGVGAKPVAGAEVIIDGSRKLLDDKWTYWQGQIGRAHV